MEINDGFLESFLAACYRQTGDAESSIISSVVAFVLLDDIMNKKKEEKK